MEPKPEDQPVMKKRRPKTQRRYGLRAFGTQKKEVKVEEEEPAMLIQNIEKPNFNVQLPLMPLSSPSQASFSASRKVRKGLCKSTRHMPQFFQPQLQHNLVLVPRRAPLPPGAPAVSTKSTQFL